MKKDKINKQTESLILYEYIYDKMYQVAGRSKEITIRDSKKIVAHAFNINYSVWACILKIMEDMKWIVKKNKHIILVKKKPRNIVENLGKYYSQVGLWEEEE